MSLNTRTLLVIAMAVLGCATERGVSWGPLAVMRTDSGMAARNEGTLVLADRCVFLERSGERELLVWPADQTSWRPATSEISFRSFNGDTWTLRDGQRVVLGGGALSPTLDGPDGEKIVRQIDWVAAPHPDCVGNPMWLVSDVQAE
jgi:hypothetical protein